ncbi:MAG: plasmid replication protein RepC [Janthinobacterium lividum]
MQIEPALPTGRRKITARMIAVQAGRPSTWEPVQRGLVWGAFKRAAPGLGVPRRVVELIDFLIGCTMDADWREGEGRLLVWPSNDVLMDALDVGLSQLKTLLRLAQEYGLIEMCDSANGKRYGWRANGRVVEAYGFDLAPFAARHAEFQAIAAAHEERRREGRRMRGRIGALRKYILSLIDAGAEQSAAAADWSALARRGCELAALRGDSRDPTYLGTVMERLTALFEEVQAALAMFKPVETNPKGAENRPHYTPTNHQLIAKANTVVVGPERPCLPEKKKSEAPCTPPNHNHTSALRGFVVTTDFLLKIAPSFRGWVNSARPSWSELEEAAGYVRSELDISLHAWGQACVILGRMEAITMLATISARHMTGKVRSPGGLLRKMVDLHREGGLRLDRTLFGLAKIV